MRPRAERRSGSFWSGLLTGLILTLALFSLWWQMPQWAGAVTDEEPSDPVQQSFVPVHVLVLGVDEREDETGRSDTMLLLRIAQGEVRLLTIPRDTLVNIEGHNESKANSAYTYGGSELAMEVVGQLLDLPVDHYVKVNLAGFRRLVDLMGGVEYDVTERMYYHDPEEGLLIDLHPGPQLLDGAKAEQFVRYRSDEIGDDVGRTGRQQDFLRAAARQALIPANLPRLPQLLLTARSYVQTDLPAYTQLKLAHALYGAQQRGTIIAQSLPGQGEYIDGISFYLPDQERLSELLSHWQ